MIDFIKKLFAKINSNYANDKVIIQDKLDKISTNLYVGKIIDGYSIKCKIVEFDRNNMKIEIIKIYNSRMMLYVNVGETYPVIRHTHWDSGEMEVWEIPSKYMNRDVSQMIFQWESGIGWGWELDC